MDPLPLSRAFTLIEPGPVVLVTTREGGRDNVMTVSWTMVLDFTGRFALTTGPWNHSFAALVARRECVVAIPPADMIDTVVGIGTCSGTSVDKFAAFDLRRAPASRVAAPLLPDCLANIECRLIDRVEAYDMLILESLAAWYDPARAATGRTLHAVGDGTFRVDGERLDRRDAMRSRLPDGL